MTTVDLSYPIGKFQKETNITAARRQALIDGIAKLPLDMRSAVNGLLDPQLDTPYRPGGWTVRQVIHHVPDSHLNAYIRFKLALTESEPTIKPYDEKQWAELADVKLAPIEVSLSLLENLHARWTLLSRALASCVFENVSTSGNWPADLGHPTWALRMAWPPPSRTHHLAANSNGLELRQRSRWLLNPTQCLGSSTCLLHRPQDRSPLHLYFLLPTILF